MAQCHYSSRSSDDEKKKGKKHSSSSGFGRRCSNTLREFRGRFYILRRCTTILLCWHKYG
ncbi:hypothetical protein AHAS_Ahas18G0067100 [Arachis hypogaea]